MTSYTINDVDATIKVGTFVAYASTATPPDGWIACDGVEKTNTNNIYGILITMGIGSGTGTQVNGVFPNYKSPDLSGQIMTGLLARPSGLTLNGRSGSDSISLSVSNLPSHCHTITLSDASHTHIAVDYVHGVNVTEIYPGVSGPAGNDDSVGTRTETTVATDDSHTHSISVGNVVGWSSAGTVSCKNKSYYIIWIVKYV